MTRKTDTHVQSDNLSHNLLICKTLNINSVIKNGQLHVERGQQKGPDVQINIDESTDVAQQSTSANTNWVREDNLFEELDAERTQVKQEDNIARLWSVSCELFLNCRLLGRSKGHHSSLQFHLWVSRNVEHVHTVCA